MQFMELIPVYSENHSKPINAQCGWNVEFVGEIENQQKVW
jgi:hypothetical protein